jgi:mono/diheme cytochrome c family protein
VFARSCGGCHTLAGHDTQARGGDLAMARLSVGDVEGFVRVMPVRLAPPQVAAVAAYVHAVAARQR